MECYQLLIDLILFLHNIGTYIEKEKDFGYANFQTFVFGPGSELETLEVTQ